MAGRTELSVARDEELVPKLIRWPADWVARIDAVRGDESFSDFVRNKVRAAIDDGSLSTPPQWGQGRPKQVEVPSVVDVVEEIRRLTEHELNRHQKKPKKIA